MPALLLVLTLLAFAESWNGSTWVPGLYTGRKLAVTAGTTGQVLVASDTFQVAGTKLV